jgi:hypothetical protein
VKMGKKPLRIGWGDHSFLHHVVAHFSKGSQKSIRYANEHVFLL